MTYDTQRKKTFQCWSDMKQRCYNTKCHNYKNYGGRGISVCESWKNSFSNFVKDMGLKQDGLTLDRIDNNGNYEPANCRWATCKQQNANRRDCVILTANGVSAPLEIIAKMIGRNPTTLRSRIRSGWPIASITDPKSHAGSKRFAAMKEAAP